MVDKSRPIIIIKKKVSHGGHHGGAWKVAYADFVTAMMALFIVLWLLNTSKPVKEAIAGYFQDPSGTGRESGTTRTGAGKALLISKDNMAALKNELQKSIEQLKDFDKLKDQIEMTITPEGLRIELLETAKGTFFDLGSHKPNEKGEGLLAMLAEELGKLDNKISIEGHTDSKPYIVGRDYTNWELSTDRANGARRLMQEKGLRNDQVSQVRGFADQHLRNTEDPFDAANRRISVIVNYIEKPPADETSGEPGEHPAAEVEGAEPDSAPGEAKPEDKHAEH